MAGKRVWHTSSDEMSVTKEYGNQWNKAMELLLIE